MFEYREFFITPMVFRENAGNTPPLIRYRLGGVGDKTVSYVY